MKTLIRVRKEDVKKDSFIKRDGLDICLDYWNYFMSKNDSDLGIKNQTGLQGDGDGYGNDDTSEQRHANKVGEATNAMVNSLLAHERWAIYRSRGLCTQWLFPLLNFLDVLPKAQESLTQKLKINIATCHYF